MIDFRRHDKDGVPAKVAHIEYDPNRTARIALLHYADGEKRYILAPTGLSAGRPGRERSRRPTSSRATTCRCATSRSVPSIHAIELPPGRRREDRPLRRCAASSCSPRRAATPTLRMPSGEIRQVDAALPRHGRRGRQRRAVATSTGARPAACAGRASARPSAVSR